MNNDRRKTLSEIQKRLKSLMTSEVLAAIELLKGLDSSVDDLKSDLESVKDDEQNYLDNMPESLQQGEKASAAQSAIDAMEQADSALDDLKSQVESLTEAAEGIQEHIDLAEASVEEASQY